MVLRIQSDGGVALTLMAQSPVLRAGLSHIISKLPECRLLPSPKETELPAVVSAGEQSQIVLLESCIPGVKQLVRKIRQRNAPKVLIVLERYADFWELLPEQADGYLHRDDPEFEIHRGIQEAAAGRAFMSNAVVEYVLRRAHVEGERVRLRSPRARAISEQLSPREHQVLHLLGQGKRNAEIAEEMGLSVETVKAHLKRIFKKLGVQDRTHAVMKVFGK